MNDDQVVVVCLQTCLLYSNFSIPWSLLTLAQFLLTIGWYKLHHPQVVISWWPSLVRRIRFPLCNCRARLDIQWLYPYGIQEFQLFLGVIHPIIFLHQLIHRLFSSELSLLLIDLYHITPISRQDFSQILSFHPLDHPDIYQVRPSKLLHHCCFPL